MEFFSEMHKFQCMQVPCCKVLLFQNQMLTPFTKCTLYSYDPGLLVIMARLCLYIYLVYMLML